MKVLIIKSYIHHKNKQGLEEILKFLNIHYIYGLIKDIKNFDIIYSPTYPIDTSKYYNKKFIFGPHFSIFPDNKLTQINNTCNNSIYILPSKWCDVLWTNLNVNKIIPIKIFSFPVNTDKFSPTETKKEKVFIYFKRRDPNELKYIENFLKNKNIQYTIFNYVKGYDEKEYIKTLQSAKYGIWLGAHESQGFALQEALSCNVPLLVWNVKNMNQEYGFNYPSIPATTIPYWDNRCGEFFYEQKDFLKTYDKFILNLNSYKPRKYILENLSVKKCSENFIKLINKI